MKIKHYKVSLSSPYVVTETIVKNYNEVNTLFDALDTLWRYIDYEVWNLEITPYWMEVDENAS